MKKFLVLAIIFVVVMAGAAFAADEAAPADNSADTTLAVQENQSVEYQPVKKPSVGYGLMVGLYNPSDSEVKGIFGDNWVRYGLRPLPKDLPERWRPHFDLSVYSMSHNNDSVMVVPVTIGMLKGISENKNMKSYMAVNAGPYYADLDAPSIGKSKKGVGFGANATVGVVFSDRLSVEARYEALDDFAGLDFSAFTVSAAFKIFNARF